MAELQIPITKAKGKFVTIDTDKIPAEVYTEAMIQGLKVLANRGTSKITAASYPDAEERAAAAVEMAEKQVELINTGKIKFTGQKKAAGISGEVKTEAMRLAKALVKDEMKKNGIKISHVEASEITRTAKDWLEAMPEIYEQAKATIEARKAMPVPSKVGVKGIKISEKLVEKAEAKKAKAGTLSAKQAGKVKTRAKGAQATA